MFNTYNYYISLIIHDKKNKNDLAQITLIHLCFSQMQVTLVLINFSETFFM